MPDHVVLIAIIAVLIGIVVLLMRRRTAGGLRVTGVLHVNINCSDFERSRAFYERLGFKVIMEVAPDGSGDVAAAVGLQEYRVRGALMAHRDGTTLDLLEWQEPRAEAPPERTLQDLGIARLAFTTADLDGDVATLRAQGVEFVSERPGAVPDPLGGTTRFICFADPDGTVLELVGDGAGDGRHLPRHEADPEVLIPRS